MAYRQHPICGSKEFIQLQCCTDKIGNLTMNKIYTAESHTRFAYDSDVRTDYRIHDDDGDYMTIMQHMIGKWFIILD